MNITQTKILLLEDQEDDAELIKRMLHKEGITFTLVRVDDRDNFERELVDFSPDIILSDHSLPQFNSIEALKICLKEKPGIPFILVTGAVSDEFAVQCIKMGADDYILKTNISRLPASIKNALQHRALERQRAEDERLLREQNAKLSKANKEIDSFVYSVSHNLRSPIASVLGLVNLARHEISTLGFDPALFIRMIEQNVLKLDDTIKEILEYARNERLEVTVSPVDMKAIMVNSLESLKHLNRFNQVDKIMEIPSGPTPYTDAYRLSVIATSLFSNCIKFQDETKTKSYLKCTVTIDKMITLIISDNGIGIRPQSLEHVYEMFYRGTVKSDGAGLGLYIVREMIKKLEGSIQIQSELGLFTSVTVILPNLKDLGNTV